MHIYIFWKSILTENVMRQCKISEKGHRSQSDKGNWSNVFKDGKKKKKSFLVPVTQKMCSNLFVFSYNKFNILPKLFLDFVKQNCKYKKYIYILTYSKSSMLCLLINNGSFIALTAEIQFVFMLLLQVSLLVLFFLWHERDIPDDVVTSILA